MITDTDEFLEHYGVKGMKWGVRKARQSRASYKRYKSKSLDERSQIKRKAAKRAAVGGAVALGAAAAGRVIYNRNKKVTVGVAKYGFQTKSGKNFYAGYTQKQIRAKNIPKLQNDPWARTIKTWSK